MGRLITDADVRDGRVTDPIVIDRDTLITPSALDRARLLGMRVVFQRGGTARADAKPRSSSSIENWPDGDYLVAVQSGRAIIHRIEGGIPRRVDPLGERS